MTIVEIQNSKLEHISEYAEKVVKYGKHLLECLEELGGGDEQYAERYGKRHPYGFRHHREDPYEYPRYY